MASGIGISKIGNTGLSVPQLCFGSSALSNMPGAYGYEVDEERGKDTIRAIFEGPVKFIDTARNYGWGRSEQMIGDVLREIGGMPSGFAISTKLDRDTDTDKLDAAQARRSLEESLAALGLDRVDMLHLHDPEYAKPLSDVTGPGGALSEIMKMKEEGLAAAIGLAAGNVDVMMPILRDWDFDCLITHNRFTLLNRNAEPMMDLAKSRGISVLNAAPYGSGVLAKGSSGSRRYAYQDVSDEALEPVRRIEAICARHGVPMGAAALQFSMRDPRIASSIIGISKPERIATTLEWAEWDIPAALWDDLAEVPLATDDPEATRVYDPGD